MVILSRSTFLSCRGRIEKGKDEETKQFNAGTENDSIVMSRKGLKKKLEE